ncbi:translation initiation factor IF-3 [Candidatus Dojkabacteria bacterium]|jgi:translation initiation factor IF-3|nr:translation initiation factor IF-3 [Candidatus Dojkabacteria bacterium]
MAYINQPSQWNKPKRDFGPRRNEYIRVMEVMVINEEGENLGVMKTFDALRLAREAGVDLVEVSPMATPPVCRIIDYAKYSYEQKKKERERRAITKELKIFEFSPVIDVHDKETKIRRAKDFLTRGHQVRLIMMRKARRKKGRIPPQLASSVFADILTNFVDYNTIEPGPKAEGSRLYITYKPNGKTENKQNSIKESKTKQPKGESKAESLVQQVSPAPLKDKVVKKVKKKES